MDASYEEKCRDEMSWVHTTWSSSDVREDLTEFKLCELLPPLSLFKEMQKSAEGESFPEGVCTACIEIHTSEALVAELERFQGHLRLESGDWIGWDHDHSPIYSRGEHGITEPGDDEKAIQLAEIEVQTYDKYALFLRDWIAEMRIGKSNGVTYRIDTSPMDEVEQNLFANGWSRTTNWARRNEPDQPEWSHAYIHPTVGWTFSEALVINGILNLRGMHEDPPTVEELRDILGHDND